MKKYTVSIQKAWGKDGNFNGLDCLMLENEIGNCSEYLSPAEAINLSGILTKYAEWVKKRNLKVKKARKTTTNKQT